MGLFTLAASSATRRAPFWPASAPVRSRVTVSNLLQPLNILPHGQTNPKAPSAEPSSESSLHCRSSRLLIDQGLIRPLVPGIFHYLPLATRSLQKLTNLADGLLQTEAQCQKVLLPALCPADLWEASGRREQTGSQLVTLKDRHDKSLVLCPTHEETITSLLAGIGLPSYRSLPIKLYQISTKWRDELKPRYGLIRGREFVMKDLYTFDRDVNEALKTYELIQGVYGRFFDALGVPYLRVSGDTGNMGGTSSHEYQFPSDIGQDVLFICGQCGSGFNKELVEEAETCPKCNSGDLSQSKGIEVGHTFLLGDKYSKVLGAQFLSENGKPRHYEMGCYGLGISRIMAASVEVLSKEKEIRWPDAIVPYSIILLAPKKGSWEYAAIDKVLDFYDELSSKNSSFKNDVILDDRNNMTVGKKLREAKQTGYRFVVLFGKECLEHDRIELFDLSSSSKMSGEEPVKMTLSEAREFFGRQNNDFF